MRKIVKEMESTFSNRDDFLIEEEKMNKIEIYLIGYNTLVDLTKSKLYIQQMAASTTTVKALLTILSDQINVDTGQLIKAVLDGKLVIISKDREENAIVDPIAQNLSSSIAEPKNESPIHASMDALEMI